MKVLEKLEDYKLPDVGSAKVKECMQDAVERALQLQKKNEEAGENYPITVENFPEIFHTLSDCDFENEKCINKVFKMIIDRVFVSITADKVLGVLNDAYAIAIDVMNTECPEYEVPKYYRFVNNHRRSVVEMEMVMACAIYVAYTNEIIGNVFDKYFEETRYIEVFYITIRRYVSFLYEHSKGRIDDSTFSSEELNIFNDLDSVLLPNYNDFYDFLDAIVRYAEELPADEWSAINAIGHMLQAKDAAGRYIPTEMYQEYEQRIGRLANYPKPKTGAKDGNEDDNAAKGAPPSDDVGELDADEKENKIRVAITKLMEIKNNKVEKKQWYAVYKVLCARQLYTKNLKSFANDLEKWGFASDVYESLKVSTNLPDNVSVWRDKAASATRADMKLIDTSILFMECLR